MLSDENVVAIIDAHRRQSLGDETSTVSTERADALDHYHGRPYGDEQDGRSQVVSKDLSETIDWIMPAIMKTFFQSGSIVEFSPRGEDDEEKAQQETDYVNHIILNDNDGFLTIHDWVKDALILKNGYIKHWYDESTKTTEEEYEGLSILELAQLQSEYEQEQAEIEILEQDSDIQLVDGQEVELFAIKVRVTRDTSKVCVEAIPTEEIRISKRARKGTQETPFIEHFTVKTRSELIEMGMDEDFVNNLPSRNSDDENDNQKDSRDSIPEESDQLGTSFDRSMDDIDYGEAYIRIDYDQDGVAELRKIITVANRIPPGNEWNEIVDTVAITSVCTKRIPHRHIGESIDDDLEDLQRIKTVLTRQMLDNVFATNNQEWLVNERVHLPDFLESLPGGVKRVMDDLPVTGSAEPVQVRPILDQILPTIDYIDGVKNNRTGINELSTNVDPDVLRDTTKGAYMEGVQRAGQKVEMIIRMIAETGVKELIKRVHELLIKHQDKDRIIKLRGKYVSVNPKEWRDRNDLRVKVGLGTGTEEERRQKLGIMLELQTGIRELGLVGPQQAYNLFDDMADTLGYPTATKYVMDPQGEEYQQLQQAMAQQEPPPNPLAEVEAVRGQFNLQQTELESQVKMLMDQQSADQKAALEELKLQVESANKEADRVSRETIETAKLEIQTLLAGLKEDLGKPGIGAGLQEKTFDPTTGAFV